jgi:hypothetical protein
MDRYLLTEQLDVMVLLILVKTIVGELFQPLVLGWVLSKEDFIANVKESIY